MWRVFVLCLMTCLIKLIFGTSIMQQHRYIVYQKNMVIEDINSNMVDFVEASVYKLNETTNALNLSVRFKYDLPDDSKVLAIAMKATNGQYRTNLFQISKTLQSALQMEMFDLDSFYMRYTNPPFVWPIRKWITYRSLGWSPDSTKFPPNLPSGEWKVPIIIRFANKTKMVTANWFLQSKPINYN